MLRNLLFVLSCFVIAANSACSTVETPNANTSVGDSANVVSNLDPANMPPGFSTNSIPLSANSTPGIPDQQSIDANKMPTGNIPGIPDPNKIGKTPQPKNTPRIPGIPDQETINKQMNTPLNDVNIVNNPPKSQSDANNRPPQKPRGNRQP